MKVLLGALVGMLLGTAVVSGLTVAGVSNSYWPILIVGVVAGVAMGRIASGSRARYLKGGTAAVVTALAMIAGQVGAAQILSKQASQIQPIASPSGTEEAAEEAGNSAPAENAVATVEEVDSLRRVNNNVPVTQINATSGDFSPVDIGFFAVGCLIAYQLGKGNEGTPAATDPADQASADPQAPSDAADA